MAPRSPFPPSLLPPIARGVDKTPLEAISESAGDVISEYGYELERNPSRAKSRILSLESQNKNTESLLGRGKKSPHLTTTIM